MAILEIGRDGRPARNFRNGRFLKGIIPFNKGKKWSEYLDPATAERCLRAGLKNLHGRMDIGGWNKRAVMAILDDGRYFWFESATAAARPPISTDAISRPAVPGSETGAGASAGSSLMTIIGPDLSKSDTAATRGWPQAIRRVSRRAPPSSQRCADGFI